MGFKYTSHSAEILAELKAAKIETLYNVYYFKHKGEMYCCVRSEGGEQP